VLDTLVEMANTDLIPIKLAHKLVKFFGFVIMNHEYKIIVYGFHLVVFCPLHCSSNASTV